LAATWTLRNHRALVWGLVTRSSADAPTFQ